MSINIKIKGQSDTDEYKAGQELKAIFEKSLPQEIEGDITIVSNVTLFGQEVKDVDLVVFGKVGQGFKRKLKFRPRDQEEYINKNVYFSNFCFAIELKKHSLKDIHINSPLRNFFTNNPSIRWKRIFAYMAYLFQCMGNCPYKHKNNIQNLKASFQANGRIKRF